MANLIRGEIDAELDGKTCRLCLTLGALADLESSFGEPDLMALAERFESGRLKSDDLIRVIGAGLRGAGADVSDKEVAQMRVPNGAAGYVDVVARLLSATFGLEGNGQAEAADAEVSS